MVFPDDESASPVYGGAASLVVLLDCQTRIHLVDIHERIRLVVRRHVQKRLPVVQCRKPESHLDRVRMPWFLRKLVWHRQRDMPVLRDLHRAVAACARPLNVPHAAYALGRALSAFSHESIRHAFRFQRVCAVVERHATEPVPGCATPLRRRSAALRGRAPARRGSSATTRRGSPSTALRCPAACLSSPARPACLTCPGSANSCQRDDFARAQGAVVDAHVVHVAPVVFAVNIVVAA